MKAPLALAASLLLLSVPAFGADDGETIQQARETVEAVDKARKAGDREALQTAFARLIELHNGIEDNSWRAKLQAAAGSVIKDKKHPELHDAAVGALESLNDGDGVYKQLKPILPKPKDAEVSDTAAYAVGVLGIVKAPSAVKYLTDLAVDGAHVGVRSKAIIALGQYHDVDKANVKALDGLVKVLQKSKPGPDDKKEKKDTWASIESCLVKALNDLTQKELDSADKWLSWADSNKGKFKDVFADGD